MIIVLLCSGVFGVNILISSLCEIFEFKVIVFWVYWFKLLCFLIVIKLLIFCLDKESVVLIILDLVCLLFIMIVFCFIVFFYKDFSVNLKFGVFIIIINISNNIGNWLYILFVIFSFKKFVKLNRS